MFKTMTGCLDKRKNPSTDEINKIPSYIFCRWLSGNPHAIFAANQINIYSNIPMENQYHMIKSAFGGKIKYIPYPKNTDAKQISETEIIAKHFKINVSMVPEYLELIDASEHKEIIDMYTE